jgi:hypothetical protein
LIAEGDKVAALRAVTGKIEVQAMNFYRVSDGQIVEERAIQHWLMRKGSACSGTGF